MLAIQGLWLCPLIANVVFACECEASSYGNKIFDHESSTPPQANGVVNLTCLGGLSLMPESSTLDLNSNIDCVEIIDVTKPEATCMQKKEKRI